MSRLSTKSAVLGKKNNEANDPKSIPRTRIPLREIPRVPGTRLAPFAPGTPWETMEMERQHVEMVQARARPQKRGYVDVDWKDVQTEHFKMAGRDSSVIPDRGDALFMYERDARRSILAELGAEMDGEQGASGRDNLNIYAKAGDRACVEILTACILGVSTFQLPSAFAKCGLIPGTIALVTLSATLMFLNVRIVELPSMLEVRVPGYAGISKHCLPHSLHCAMVALLVCSWYGITLIRQKEAVINFVCVFRVGADKTVANEDEVTLDRSLWYFKILYVFLLLPVSFCTRLSSVGKCAKHLNRMIVVMAVGELLAGLVYRVSEGAEGLMPHAWVGNQIMDGLYEFGMSFIGIGILPYLIADMSSPHNAAVVINKALIKVAVFYTILTLGLYFTWGEEALQRKMHPMTQMLAEKTWRKWVYGVCYVVYHLALAVSSMLTFPLFFWPLQREVERIIGLESSPALQLQLPWAMKNYSSKRRTVETGLVLSMLVPFLLPTGMFAYVKALIISGPVYIVHLVFPAWAALLAIMHHWSAVHFRLSRTLQLTLAGKHWWDRVPPKFTRDYFVESFTAHLLATFVVAMFLTVSAALVAFDVLVVKW